MKKWCLSKHKDVNETWTVFFHRYVLSLNWINYFASTILYIILLFSFHQPFLRKDTADHYSPVTADNDFIPKLYTTMYDWFLISHARPAFHVVLTCKYACAWNSPYHTAVLAHLDNTIRGTCRWSDGEVYEKAKEHLSYSIHRLRLFFLWWPLKIQHFLL